MILKSSKVLKIFIMSNPIYDAIYSHLHSVTSRVSFSSRPSDCQAFHIIRAQTQFIMTAEKFIITSETMSVSALFVG